MPPARKPPARPAPPPHPAPGPFRATSAAARVSDVTAAKLVARTGPPTGAVYQPWAKITAQAEARYKAEMSAALARLQQAAADAGQLLDTAQVSATQTSGSLRAAAWSAFEKYMAAADAVEQGILNPAYQAYDARIAEAHSQFERAIGDAETTYRQLLADAQRAQNDAGAISQAG